MSAGEERLISHAIPLSQYDTEVENHQEEFGPAQTRHEEGDNAYVLICQATNVERAGYRFMVGTPGPSGTEISITQSECFSMEVGVSAQVGVGLLEGLSASIGFEAPSSYETTTTFGHLHPFNHDVGSNGALYW